MELGVAFLTPSPLTFFSNSSLPTSATSTTFNHYHHARRPHPRRPFLSHPTVSCKSKPSQSTTSNQQSLSQVFAKTSLPETLFSNYVHPTPQGTAALAATRNIPLRDISTSYGHILAITSLEDFPPPNNLHAETVITSLHSFVTSSSPDQDKQKPDLTKLSGLVSRATDGKELLNNDEIGEMSVLYGRMLGTSVKLSGLEFDATALRDGFEARLQDDLVKFPMQSRDVFNAEFAKLQKCAAVVAGTAAVDAADSFFKKSLLASESCIDVEGDGYIVAFDHGEVGNGDEIGEESNVTFALRARLFDGRCILMADESEGGVDVQVNAMPRCFGKAIIGMKIGCQRTIFFHPYAAHEVLPIFLEQGQIPSQMGLVLDLSAIHVEKR